MTWRVTAPDSTVAPLPLRLTARRDNPALVDEISRKVLEKRGMLEVMGGEASANGTPPAEPAPAKADQPRKRAAAAAPSES